MLKRGRFEGEGEVMEAVVDLAGQKFDGTHGGAGIAGAQPVDGAFDAAEHVCDAAQGVGDGSERPGVQLFGLELPRPLFPGHSLTLTYRIPSEPN